MCPSQIANHHLQKNWNIFQNKLKVLSTEENMKHSQAEKIIRNALFCTQKNRSIVSENLEGVSERVKRFFEPKTHDERWLLKPLLKITEQIEDGKQIKPMDFYNIMVIIYKFAPELQILAAAHELPDFPEPDIAWLKGCEQE
jgi:hypothetical protein